MPIMLSLLWMLLLCLPIWVVTPANASNIQSSQSDRSQFINQRQQMVEQQIRARGIEDKTVLQAMLNVPRHCFVNPSQVDAAYADYPLPLEHQQTISQPYIVAYMTAAAEISATDRVLEIGTGSGYQAAVLGEIAKEVYTVELIPQLAATAQQTLNELGYHNVHVKRGDGYQGWAENAPYQAIIVTAAPEHIPEALVEQLAINGRMVIPVGKSQQEIVVLTKTPDGLSQQKTMPVRFVPMRTQPPN